MDKSTSPNDLHDKFILPHSLDAEKAVLGAVLRDSDQLTLVEGMLQPKHFFLDAHIKIYEAILELSSLGELPDIVTVAEKLRQFDGDENYLGPRYLVDLTENCPYTQHVEFYSNIVRRYFYLRKIIQACHETIDGAMRCDGNVEEYIEDIEKEFLSISSEYDRKGIVRADEVLKSTVEEIQKSLEADGNITGIPSGFVDLDELTGGLQGSDLIILAARPGMGKTAFALNIVTNAVFSKKSVVFFTLEMSKEQLMARILSAVARVDSSRLRKGGLSEDELDRLMDGARKIHEYKDFLGVDETPGITLMELRSRCRRYKKEFGLDFVVIDYLQLMGSNSRRNESREREISQISMGLKELAKELKIPVVSLAQLNRGPDSRTNDKRPKISDLRESGSLEQDADLIMFIYRDEYYNTSSEDAGIAEIIIGKNRHGDNRTIKLSFQPSFVSFQNLYKEKH